MSALLMACRDSIAESGVHGSAVVASCLDGIVGQGHSTALLPAHADASNDPTRALFGRIIARQNRRSRANERFCGLQPCDGLKRRSRLAKALIHAADARSPAPLSFDPASTPSTVVPLPPTRDRRAFPRHPSRCIALIHRLEGHLPPGPQLEWAFHGTRWSGEVIDISMSGAALLVETSPAVNDMLRLRFQNRLLGSTVDASATVLRGEPAEDGRIKIMCEFLRHMPLDQVRSLGWEPFESSLI
jgi:hypothetical protein